LYRGPRKGIGISYNASSSLCGVSIAPSKLDAKRKVLQPCDFLHPMFSGPPQSTWIRFLRFITLWGS